MPYEFFIALRYLRAGRRNAVLSTITLISVLGIAVGVWALVVVLAFQTGMEQEIQSRILAATSHLNLLRENDAPFADTKSLITLAEGVAGVKAASATVYVEVLLSSPERSRAAVLKAVDLGARPEANEVHQTIIEGSVESLGRGDESGVILGRELAREMGVKVGEVINAISPEGRLTPAGLAPRQKTFLVTGIFESGLYDYDANWGYISMESASELLMVAEPAGVIQMKVDNIYRVKQIAAEVLARCGPGYKTTDWQQLNRSVFAALNLQRLGFFVGIALIILVASLNIITTLIMMVVEKTRDVAVLISMGATSRSVLLIFMVYGLVIGLVGMLLGGVSGVVTCSIANTYKLIHLDPKIYSISYVPFRIVTLDVLIVTVTTAAISFLATIYPAYRASKLIPVEGLRYE